ncbi:hypothetical protein SIAM614_31046 [Roseibium aggregatum IAM 12614]|jgi:hypothetical protein|uniref:Uncharacterized protein n=1 Tax=Roseibium aggregatum (strain ATCC 25650 / DSM 13394 / JCM 20685 / NBRC 16684 / NCIMB 2208 / IAM 12614 / B1) TaxID=384765 RepID=A0NZC1_ROSAI|nr:hypothetical protein SIAM614_31046 [Roseibium aggregatum IAM 12614]
MGLSSPVVIAIGLLPPIGLALSYSAERPVLPELYRSGEFM